MRQRKPIAWEVQTFTLCDGWINTWFVDDEPERFATRRAAQTALDEFLTEIADEIACGIRAADEGYSADEFRVVPVIGGASC
ncbi:MAG: hypothetical protein GC150_07415 [Rhizobiales bacterium]|nr:hypothetical protein [Hyphomicrobiales bacterium]